MDSTPFLEINLLDTNEVNVTELKKFTKENFDIEQILDTASELKYLGLIKKILKDEFSNPSDEFVRLILNNNVYDGVKTQAVVEKYKPIVKRSITSYLNELINSKIKSVLTSDDMESEIVEVAEDEEIPSDGIVTTEDELQAYYIVKSILGDCVPLERITYKDTISYFSVQIDNKVTRWICRIYFKENVKYIVIPNDSEAVKYTLDEISDIYKLSNELKQRASKLI